MFYWVIIVVSTIPTFLLLRKVLFEDWADFFDGVGYCMKPDIWSAFHGEYWEDQWQSMKVGIVMMGTVATGAFVDWKFGSNIRGLLPY